jgi:addiction module RelB/DinJ family antitoxin
LPRGELVGGSNRCSAAIFFHSWCVGACIDTNRKERAAEALEAMGLSISDAIHLLMLRIADGRRLPFEVKVFSKSSRKALAFKRWCSKGRWRRAYVITVWPVNGQDAANVMSSLTCC